MVNKYRIDYKLFKEVYPKVKGNSLQYSKVWHTYIKILFKYMLAGHFIKTPIGTLRIIKKKVSTKNIAINWKETKKERVAVYHFNDHSGGYKVLPSIRRNKKVYKYSCKFSRSIDRAIAKHIFEDKDNYKKYETYKSKYINI